MIIKTCVLSLSFALSIGVAAAQAPSWPIVEAVTCSRPNSRSTAGEITGPASGVVMSSRRPPASTTRLCADPPARTLAVSKQLEAGETQ